MFSLSFVALHMQLGPFHCLVILLNIAAELAAPGRVFQNKMLLNANEVIPAVLAFLCGNCNRFFLHSYFTSS